MLPRPVNFRATSDSQMAVLRSGLYFQDVRFSLPALYLPRLLLLLAPPVEAFRGSCRMFDKKADTATERC